MALFATSVSRSGRTKLARWRQCAIALLCGHLHVSIEAYFCSRKGMKAVLLHSLLCVHIVSASGDTMDTSKASQLSWQRDKSRWIARLSMQLVGRTGRCPAFLSGCIAGDRCRVASGSSHVVGIDLHASFLIRLPERPRSCIHCLCGPLHGDYAMPMTVRLTISARHSVSCLQH